MIIKLKVDEDNLRKMTEGKEFKAKFSHIPSTQIYETLTEIYVYPVDIKEINKHMVIVKEKLHN
jgi:hypothetical protein